MASFRLRLKMESSLLNMLVLPRSNISVVAYSAETTKLLNGFIDRLAPYTAARLTSTLRMPGMEQPGYSDRFALLIPAATMVRPRLLRNGSFMLACTPVDWVAGTTR